MSSSSSAEGNINTGFVGSVAQQSAHRWSAGGGGDASACVAGRSMRESQFSLAEIVGEESLRGRAMSAGYLLRLIDICAGRVSWLHSRCATTTACFEKLAISRPVLHNDLVRAEGRLVDKGRSSMNVFVEVFRQDVGSGKFLRICHCNVRMVALDAKTGRPNPNIPDLVLTEEELQQVIPLRGNLKNPRQRASEEEEPRPLLTKDLVEDPCNQDKDSWVHMDETEVVQIIQPMPMHLNILNTVFGGDLLQLMERTATYTARLFCGDRNTLTVRMHDVSFRMPVQVTDLVKIRGRVSFVRNTNLQVLIEVWVIKPDGQEVLSHDGHFTVGCFDEVGCRSFIEKGILLDDEDEQSLVIYHQARRIHEELKEFESKHGEIFLLNPRHKGGRFSFSAAKRTKSTGDA